MLTAVAAFAEVFTHPATIGLVVALTLLVRHPARLRLAAAILGAVLSLPATLEAGGILEGAAALLGGVAAALLQAEVMLHIVVPACSLAWRLACAAWALACAAFGMLFPFNRPHPPRRPLPPIEPEP